MKPTNFDLFLLWINAIPKIPEVVTIESRKPYHARADPISWTLSRLLPFGNRPTIDRPIDPAIPPVKAIMDRTLLLLHDLRKMNTKYGMSRAPVIPTPIMKKIAPSGFISREP